MEKFMRRAIELAERGMGFVNPNPLVGAVIVKNNRIIGEGFHEKYGALHAERSALKNASEDVEGADMYVTLEPCCHTGKQPPCTDAIIESGIKRVFIGSRDPNPLVARNGVQLLREHGVEVTEDFLREECDALNDIFFHYITAKTPYVILKMAITIDGKIAAAVGDSKWITNEKSRMHTHETRKRVMAILAGSNTVIADDPTLNCRAENPSHPIRVVCDSHFSVPLTARVIQTAGEIPTYIAYTDGDTKKEGTLKSLGVNLIKTPKKDGHVDLAYLMRTLGEMGIDSVLIEGGGQIHASALKSGTVNKLQIYLAPKIIGGDGVNAIAHMGIRKVSDAVMLEKPKITQLDGDILIEYEVRRQCLRE